MANITSLKREVSKTMLDQDVVSVTVDVNTVTTNVGASDTVDLLDIDPGTIKVIDFCVEVTTAEGATATADFGLKPTTGSAFTSDPNGLDDAVNLNSAAVSAGAKGTDAQMGSKIAATDGATLFMTADHALDAAIFNVSITYSQIDH